MKSLQNMEQRLLYWVELHGFRVKSQLLILLYRGKSINSDTYQAFLQENLLDIPGDHPTLQYQ